MGFIDSYKHLEKLCGEIFDDERRISAYIDEMLQITNGSYYVKSWDDDLRNLKHYRWIRNKIAHEPDCTEQNMCQPKDELWIKEFYSRIMNQTDPLSQYRKATKPYTATKSKESSKQITSTHVQWSDYDDLQIKSKIHNKITFKEFIKNEIVLIISFILAVVSAFFVTPNKGYLEYIDFRTLGLLFCLMAVMAGLNNLGVFRFIAEKMLSKVKSIFGLSLILGLLCFFSSMVITNDVALITFVPFTITALKLSGKMDKLIWIVTVETVAANLGSMLTPIGNPQNLYLFSAYNMSIGDFMSTILPYAVLSLLLVIASCLITGKGETNTHSSQDKYSFSKLHIGIFISLFIISLLTVFRVIPCIATVIITLIALLIWDRKTILKIDYSLLLTFVFLFIFIGNLGEIKPISDFLKSIVNGNEVIVGVVSSQVFSNVPATILLSKFTNNAHDLLIGVNLGGLGTLIASMASLISFKFIAKEKISTGKYILVFTVVNTVYLTLNLCLCIIIK